jgi:hypothetical protein
MVEADAEIHRKVCVQVRYRIDVAMLEHSGLWENAEAHNDL